jgi:hypothetical protein
MPGRRHVFSILDVVIGAFVPGFEIDHGLDGTPVEVVVGDRLPDGKNPRLTAPLAGGKG